MQHTPLRILLVEDEALVAMDFCETLAAHGHDVTVAPDGQLALQACRLQRPFDVLVTDLDMPGIGGRELIRQMRRDSPATPVLIVTARPALAPFLPPRKGEPRVAMILKPVRSSDLAWAVERLARG